MQSLFLFLLDKEGRYLIDGHQTSRVTFLAHAICHPSAPVHNEVCLLVSTCGIRKEDAKAYKESASSVTDESSFPYGKTLRIKRKLCRHIRKDRY